MTGKSLIVNADDFGACRAVTDGVIAAFREGVLTQASVIVPAFDSARAVRLASEAGLPLGVHLALMCEWESVRWSPLTPAPSLRWADGALPPGLAELRACARAPEVLAELRAQVAAAYRAGVPVMHVDCHIGVWDPAVLAQVTADAGVPSRDPVPPPGRTMRLDSLWHLSLQEQTTKVDALVQHVQGLREGVHMIVAHPALDRPELRQLCSPSSRRWRWAVDIRLSDLAALRDPRFRLACEDSGVTLTSLAACGPGPRPGRPEES